MQPLRATIPLCAGILLAGCGDVVKSRHPTIAHAKLDIERGWIPGILPASTIQIRESHDLDTNVGYGSFKFGAADAEMFRANLTALVADEVNPRSKIPRAQMERDGYRFYHHNDFILAIDWSRRCGEFWLEYSR